MTVVDATYKYNRMRHSTTQHTPISGYSLHASTPTIKILFVTIGSIPNCTAKKSKFEPRSIIVRYIYPVDADYILVLNPNNTMLIKTRIIAFHPRHTILVRTPQFLTNHGSHPRVNRVSTWHHIPRSITATTLDPANTAQARRYPDAAMWEASHNSELNKLDAMNTIEWILNDVSDMLPTDIKVINMSLSYCYKRNDSGEITKHKALASLQG